MEHRQRAFLNFMANYLMLTANFYIFVICLNKQILIF
jgi:hypothetical protein